MSNVTFIADENFNHRILRAIHRRLPEIDIVRVQDTIGAGVDDPAILEWAAREQRIVLTHDVQTMPDFAFDRVRAGLPMPGVIEVDDTASLAAILEDIFLIATSSKDGEWEGQVLYIPF
jgi:predicted nuclease of predicted toxin-antitoxin system